MVKRLFLLNVVFVIFLLTLLGCASSSTAVKPSIPTVVKPSIEDQMIIDAGIKKANELGLKPFPMIGEGKGGKFTVIAPAQVMYDMRGNWITTSEDLYINATQGNIVLKGLSIKRGQYAREIDYKLKIVEWFWRHIFLGYENIWQR